MAARVLVSLEDIFLTFGGKPLFTGLRMHIAEGDKICLVGKNGAGKTSLLSAIELVLNEGPRTPDLGGTASTQEVGKAVADAVCTLKG